MEAKTMRCPDCNKFVSFDSDEDPEINDLEVDSDGLITGSVMIKNNCAECGTELTEAQFDIGEQAKLEGHEVKEGCSFEVEENSAERDIKTDGKGRYTRTYYGVRAEFKVSCECGFETSVEWEDFCQASSMDQLV